MQQWAIGACKRRFAVEPEPEPGVLLIKSHSDNCKYRRVCIAPTGPPTGPVEEIAGAETFGDAVEKLQLTCMDLVPDFNNANLHYHTIRVACTKPGCPSCTRTHSTPDYVITEKIKQGCWTIQNVDPACYPRIFFHTGQLEAVLHPVLTCASHDTLSDLFLHGHGNVLWCCGEGKVIKRWEGQWRTLPTKEWASYIGWWLGSLLRAVKQLEGYTRRMKQLDKALGFINSSSQVSGVRTTVEGKLISRSRGIVFDANPLLLGGDASVIELDTAVVRPPRLEDYVSKSVGYEIAQVVSDEAWEAVTEFMARIYPVEEERRLVQQFVGYCLRGDHPAKHFLCLTDKRQGYNGKSTLCALLRTMLGDQYSRTGKKELLYEARFTKGIDDHDSGMAAFEGLRLITMEEPANTNTLDTARLKDLNGGNTQVPIREAHSTVTRQMAWTAKMICCFNQDGLPKLRVDDEAFLKRILFVQHRSRFCKTDQEWEESAEQPYTFKADERECAAVTPQAMLAWAMQGHAVYLEEGFSKIPRVCDAWLREVVEEQDEVAGWRTEHVEQKDGAWLTVKAAYDSFQTGGSKLPKTRFNARLKRALGEPIVKKIEGKACLAFEGYLLTEG